MIGVRYSCFTLLSHGYKISVYTALNISKRFSVPPKRLFVIPS